MSSSLKPFFDCCGNGPFTLNDGINLALCRDLIDTDSW